MTFVPLHLHSEYSTLDSAIRIKDLPSRIKELGMDSCALSDHGVMSGVIEFYKKCKEDNVKPILGVEAYITEDPDNFEGEKRRDNMHMVLLAKDNIGYTRLLELVSKAALNNFYYKPRIYKQNLTYLKGHVIATTACIGGIACQKTDIAINELGKAISITPKSDFQTNIDFYRSIFEEDFYLELQYWDDGSGIQIKYNEFLLEFGKKHGLPFVITADSHYLLFEDYKLHELLMAMQLKTTLDEYRANSKLKYGPYFHLAGPEEMLERAKLIGCVEAYNNTSIIAEKCNVELQLGKFKLPTFAIEQEDDYQDFLSWRETNRGKLQ